MGLIVMIVGAIAAVIIITISVRAVDAFLSELPMVIGLFLPTAVLFGITFLALELAS